MGNRMFRRGADNRDHPTTITDRPITSALQPGVAVFIAGYSITPASSVSGGRLGLLGDRDFFAAPPSTGELEASSRTDPLDIPYRAGESCVVYRLRPGQVYQWRIAAGSYSLGHELTVGTLGYLRAANSGETVVAKLDVAAATNGPFTFLAGDLKDVLIEEFYTKP